ncbi:DUF3592 domain-containing protein [Verrucomicrobium sp. BvORR034]|uniref:DUF3592 domain-containing protein n=1 Tax=Verrucomicrobium sp. BvORR034 TaxID=1396418 RepID=UPI0009DCCD89|nr:DUF3592 domain-containing protein [Verrucomicrobium sp. BvORR034]
MLKHTVNSSRSSAPMGPGMRFFFTIIFPWIFILVGGGIMYAGVTNLRNASASKNWPTVPGKVVISEVDRRRSDKGSTTYSANVVYDYLVEGTTYSAKRVSFGSGSSSNPAGARTTQNKYKVGTEVNVHYSPKDPSLAVLEPGVTGVTLLLPGIGAVFFLVGCAMAFFLPSAVKKDETSRVNA